MKIRIINQLEIQQLLSMGECIDLMSRALEALVQGKAIQPLRSILQLPETAGALGVMPGYLATEGAIGAKIITVFPSNQESGLDSHQGAILLFENRQGRLLSIMDASSVTAIRTAAVSGLATRLLARPDSSRLAILGSGVQARSHLEAMLAVRPIEKVKIWSRTVERARKLAREGSDQFGISVTSAESARSAVEDADIICTTTSSPVPVLQGEWIGEGTHINAVGSSAARTRELDTSAVVRSRLYVDCRESALHEAGDFLIPKQEGALTDPHIIGEIGEIVTGRVEGRRSPTEVTLFKSLGLAVEDVASARFIYSKALKMGIGTELELGGERL